MSEIRFQNPGLAPLYTPNFTSLANAAPAAPTQAPEEVMGGADNIFTMLSQSPQGFGSNPLAASPLVSYQADTALSITDPSQAAEGSSEGSGLKPAEQAARGTDSAASGGGVLLEKLGRNGGRLGHKLGVLGPVAGVLGEAAGLPSGFSTARDSIGKALETGSSGDIIKAGGDTAALGSGGASLLKGVLETPDAWVRGQARSQARTAFRQATPNASRAVINSAAKTAADEAMKDVSERATRRATQAAAIKTAKKTGTLASGAGVTGRAAAQAALKTGGREAAEAATKSVARSALKTAAKAGARFVPGLNVAIAGLDTAAAAATLADPKASKGKKISSVITAAGSIVAATNIPVVSQVGAAVSAASSFVGSFF